MSDRSVSGFGRVGTRSPQKKGNRKEGRNRRANMWPTRELETNR